MLEKMADPVKSGEALDLDRVVSLREQLDDLNEKIKGAQEKKHTVKPKIFQKVKADYEEKAKEIIEQLAEKAGPLKDEFKRVKEEEDRLREKRTGVEEELEEVKFRFSLGEYSKEKHDELAGEKADTLEKLEKEIVSIEKDSLLLEDILRRIEDALKPKEEPARAPEPVEPVEPAQPAEAVEEFETVEKPLERHAPEDEERHGVHVLDGEAEAAAVAAPAETEITPEDAHTRSPLDDIVRELEREMVVPEEPKPEAEEAPERVVPDAVPSGFEEESDEEKELKCPKCGFVNMADSWYCEKCGAELLGESKGGGG